TRRPKVSAFTKNFSAKPRPSPPVVRAIDRAGAKEPFAVVHPPAAPPALQTPWEISMSKRIALLAAAFGALTLTTSVIAPAEAQDKMMGSGKSNEKTVMVGGAPMYPSKDIVDNAVNSKDHTTLVAAVKAAGLVDTLKSAGPFTVFAPTNAAFSKLPAGTV